MRLQISVVYSVFLLTSLSVSRNAGGQIYNAAHDFSSTTNPNGQWSYGWSQTSGAAFNLLPITTFFYPISADGITVPENVRTAKL